MSTAMSHSFALISSVYRIIHVPHRLLLSLVALKRHPFPRILHCDRWIRDIDLDTRLFSQNRQTDALAMLHPNVLKIPDLLESHPFA